MLKIKTRVRIAIVLVFVVVISNEWLSHVIKRWDWLEFPEYPESQNKLRILFVADTQIQGYNNEPRFPIGAITRWDSDRYLKKGYEAAVQHVKPDVILFLGDEMDEGSTASMAEYKDYKKRFWHLFGEPKIGLKITIPGDNDIGGEGFDLVTKSKVKRFQDAFGNEVLTETKFVEFIKIDLMSQVSTLPKVHAKGRKIRVLLSHIPLIAYRTVFTEQIVLKLQPDLIISAHEHISHILEGNRTTGRLMKMDTMEKVGTMQSIETQKGPHLVEIIVPTCSYRLGVYKMGYGAALLQDNGHMDYTILWLPERYTQLFLYVLTLIVVFLLIVMPYFTCCQRMYYARW